MDSSGRRCLKESGLNGRRRSPVPGTGGRDRTAPLALATGARARRSGSAGTTSMSHRRSYGSDLGRRVPAWNSDGPISADAPRRARPDECDSADRRRRARPDGRDSAERPRRARATGAICPRGPGDHDRTGAIGPTGIVPTPVVMTTESRRYPGSQASRAGRLPSSVAGRVMRSSRRSESPEQVVDRRVIVIVKLVRREGQ